MAISASPTMSMWWASSPRSGSPGRLARSERVARLGGGLRRVGLRFCLVAMSELVASTAARRLLPGSRDQKSLKPCAAGLSGPYHLRQDD